MTGNTVDMDGRPYRMMMAHALKHAKRPVLGLLAGKHDKSGTTITDCFPLAHSYPPEPLLSIGFELISQECQNRNVEILGVYEGNELYDDISIGANAKSLASVIKEHSSEVVLIMIDSFAIHHENLNKPALLAYQYSSVKASVCDCPVSIQVADSDRVFDDVRDFYQTPSRCKLVADIEEHLASVDQDWTNPELFT